MSESLEGLLDREFGLLEQLEARIAAARDAEYGSLLEGKTARIAALEEVVLALLEMLIDERQVDG